MRALSINKGSLEPGHTHSTIVRGTSVLQQQRGKDTEPRPEGPRRLRLSFLSFTEMYASSWGSTQTIQTVLLSHLQAAVGFPSMSKQGHSKHQSPFKCILENNTYYHELVLLSLLYLMTGMLSFRKWIFMRGSETQIVARLLLVSQHCIVTSPSPALMVHYLWCYQLTPTLLRSLILAHTAARPSQRPWGKLYPKGQMAAAGAKGRRRRGIPVPQGSHSGAQSWVNVLRHTLLLPSHQIWIFLRNASRF